MAIAALGFAGVAAHFRVEVKVTQVKTLLDGMIENKVNPLFDIYILDRVRKLEGDGLAVRQSPPKETQMWRDKWPAQSPDPTGETLTEVALASMAEKPSLDQMVSAMYRAHGSDYIRKRSSEMGVEFGDYLIMAAIRASERWEELHRDD